MEPLVSVIIPVYKVEQYIDKCLETVLNQTYKNLEIILVDDGSPDNCPAICDGYAKKDNRVKVIHKENGGLSSARNAGLDVCTGKYVCFYDSDDFIELNTVEKSVEKLELTNADVVMYAHYLYTENKTTERLLPLDKDEYSAEEIKNTIIPYFLGANGTNAKFLYGFIWAQIFRVSSIDKMRFKSEREYYAEDIVFDLDFYKGINKMAIVNKPFYYYRFVPTSLSNVYRKNLFGKFNLHLEYMENYISENGIEKERIRILHRAFRCAVAGCINVKKGADLTKKQKVKDVKEICNNRLVKEAVKSIRVDGTKNKIFKFLVKIKAVRLILKLC